MALDLQQRPAQHGHRRHHTRYETENRRVVLQADPIKNGGITGPEAMRFITVYNFLLYKAKTAPMV
jgi:hypothetical protein